MLLGFDTFLQGNTELGGAVYEWFFRTTGLSIWYYTSEPRADLPDVFL